MDCPRIPTPRVVVLFVALSLVAGWTFNHPVVAAESPTQFYLVGVGPGDPDLITLRAIDTLKKADLIFSMEGLTKKFSPYLQGREVVYGYWRLFPFYGQDLADLEGPQRQEAEALAVKRNEFIGMVRRAIGEGKTVAVIDSGDPLIYGPWAWCLEEFEDLSPVVVPGVSAFNAGNAALRRGITNSDQTKSVILTAADWAGKTDTIDRLSTHQATMVLFTMRTDFEEFIRKLAVNYPPETPLAVVKFAGYAEREEVIQATVGTILDRVGQDGLPFEYLIYVGDFLTYRHRKTAAQ
jgi:precorrin-4/cobalt-precorrin-4 C11-methyltransferase